MYNTTNVLANCFAAYRINSNQHISDTRRYSEETPTQFSNKDLLLFKLHYEKQILPKDFVSFSVTEQDKQNAKDAVAFINKDTSLKQIAGTLTDFMKNLVTCINSEQVSQNEFGIVVLLPKVYFETKNKKEYKKKLKTEFTESRHLGIPGQYVTGLLNVNEVKFVEKFGCHVINGNIENNLVSFFKNFEAGKSVPEKGTTINIKGKVKKHGENFITKLPETQLYYVKIV